MTAATLTLTDFLLARIAEDEDLALFVQQVVAAGRGPETFEAWKLSRDDEYDLLCVEPERALTEVVSKRSMIALHSESRGGRHPAYCRTCDGLQGWPCPTLQLLATVYADHPDYREEWRP